MEINISYVDKLLRAGTDEWKTQSDVTLEQFETTENQQTSSMFAGMHTSEPDNKHHIYQNFYMNKIEQVPSNAEFGKFSPMRMKLT